MLVTVAASISKSLLAAQSPHDAHGLVQPPMLDMAKATYAHVLPRAGIDMYTNLTNVTGLVSHGTNLTNTAPIILLRRLASFSF